MSEALVRYETIEGALVHHAAIVPILHIGDHEATIEAYANDYGHVCAFIEGDNADGDANEGDRNFGYVFLYMTPAESRWLGKHLIAQADKAEERAEADARRG